MELNSETTRIFAIDAGTIGDSNMLDDKLFSEDILQYMKKGGAAAIFIVIIVLFLNYYNVIKLNNIPLPYFDTILWTYLFLNAGIATPFHYLKEKGAAKCPNCGRTLKINPSFTCDSCGSLKFLSDNK